MGPYSHLCTTFSTKTHRSVFLQQRPPASQPFWMHEQLPQDMHPCVLLPQERPENPKEGELRNKNKIRGFFTDWFLWPWGRGALCFWGCWFYTMVKQISIPFIYSVLTRKWGHYLKWGHSGGGLILQKSSINMKTPLPPEGTGVMGCVLLMSEINLNGHCN